MPKFRDWVAGRTAVTIADNDELYVRDDDANESKRITWGNVKTALGPTYAPLASLHLPGLAGNYVSTPDVASLRITGDIEFVFRIALDDYTPTAGQCVVAKRTTSAGLAYQLAFSSPHGNLTFSLRTGGVDYFSNSIFENPGWVDGTTYWFRFRRAAGTGGVTAGYAADQNAEPSLYTSLTFSSGAATAGNIDTNTAPAEFGSNRDGGVDMILGKLYRVIVRDGFDGTTVADFDASIAGGPRYRDVTGKVMTINGSGWAWSL
jgi:hypothetical protein